MDEIALSLIMWSLLCGTFFVGGYFGAGVLFRRRLRPTHRLVATQASTLVGRVVSGDPEIPSPVLGEPLCVAWQNCIQDGSSRIRPFAVETADHELVWVDARCSPAIYGGVRDVELTEAAVAWWEEQLMRAVEDLEEAAFGAEAETRPQRPSLDPNRINDEAALADLRLNHERVVARRRLQTLRVGDEVVVRGGFEPVDSVPKDYRGTSDSTRYYRLVHPKTWHEDALLQIGGISGARRNPKKTFTGVALMLFLGAVCGWIPGFIAEAMGFHIARLLP